MTQLQTFLKYKEIHRGAVADRFIENIYTGVSGFTWEDFSQPCHLSFPRSLFLLLCLGLSSFYLSVSSLSIITLFSAPILYLPMGLYVTKD
ncbi:hypothetical protein CHARACLAT_004436 [Characodon lateralis]|uniref:Uncharacterized protein n=1 Tax=Characodon lateralis TaxID=208331 RepID=A0ABU7DDZ9_9TELE|nr:hypothetical protein [Characodon lateralis]